MSDTLTILVIADPHYVRQAEWTVPVPGRCGHVGLEWIVRAIREARRFGPIDVIALPGDLVDNGAAPGAEADTRDLVEAVRATELPVVVVPGNHDLPAADVFRLFADHPGAHQIGDYLLYTFADPVAADNIVARPQSAIDDFLREAQGRRVVVMQHAPSFPPVDCAHYPYMPTNADAITASYEQAGVLLSISGHYHAGNGSSEAIGHDVFDGGGYPAEAPFPFYLVKLRGEKVEIARHELALPQVPALWDGHTHTHFGYCAEDVHPVPVAERAELLGLRGVTCVEHAPQLYLTEDDFFKARRHVLEPDAIHRAAENGTNRMAAFRQAMAAFRNDRLRVGIEVEVDRNGGLTLLEEDREGWDIMLGAIHFIPDRVSVDTPNELGRAFMRINEELLAYPINVLAHPLRIMESMKHPHPEEYYRPLAKFLAARGVAAEINFHHRPPAPAFFAICLEEGVRLVLGSDAHRVDQVGDLHPHLRLLKQIGAAADVLIQ